MINKVILVGNLGSDPELRSTQSGQSVCTIRIATTSRVKEKDGNWADRTEWHSVVVWGRDAENVHKYCRKGRQLYIEGRLQTRKWQDRDGNERYTTEIVGDIVRFLGGNSQGGEAGAGPGPSSSPRAAAPRAAEPSGGGYGGGAGGAGGGHGGGFGGGGGSAGGGDDFPPFPGDDDIPF